MKAAPLPRMAPMPGTLPEGSLNREGEEKIQFRQEDNKLRLPMLRIAVKRQDNIVYFIRVPDPREEVIAAFNAKNKHRGTHAIAMFEDSEQFRTSFEVYADGELVFRTWERPEAVAEGNRRHHAGQRVEMVRRKARIMDELTIDEEMEA